MSADEAFEAFFEEVHGVRPFPWQSDLAARATTGAWPDVVDVPTGLGKTAVIDAFVYALAAGAGDPPVSRITPSKLAFVVDRRLVVQGAFERAAHIADRLQHPTGPATSWVADRLRILTASAGSAVPLAVQQMRGGIRWSSRWLVRPDQPAVVVGTVDQIGSRLLFRGYGTSDRMKPIDAGLLGNDTLIVIDEAHMSDALLKTLGAVSGFDAITAERPLPSRRLQLMSMTATRRPDVAASRPLTIGSRDMADDEAGRRLRSEKLVHLVDLSYASSPTKAADEIAQAMASIAVSSARSIDSATPTIGVVANTIAVARAVHRLIAAAGIEDVHLVIGRCRPFDRDQREREWLPLVRTGRDRSTTSPRGPVILVATQTIEVGVDLDLDALVTEAAPIDALVQRFGRVDRLGRLGSTRSFLVHAMGRVSGDALPYGSASAATWRWLCDGHTVYAVDRRDGLDQLIPTGGFTVDFGLLPMQRQVAERGIDGLVSEPAVPPVVLPAVVNVWRRTGPVPAPDESVVQYLHGIGRGEATVAVAWRADLTEEAGQQRLQALPPDPAELVEVSLGALRRLLAGQPPVGDSDLEGEPPALSAPGPNAGVAWVRRDDRWISVVARAVLPGDIVVLPAETGGHDRHGWTGIAGHPVTDVADLVTADRLPTLRLDGQVLAPLFQVEHSIIVTELATLRRSVATGLAADGDIQPAVYEFIDKLSSMVNDAVPYADALRGLLAALRRSPFRWFAVGAASTSHRSRPAVPRGRGGILAGELDIERLEEPGADRADAVMLDRLVGSRHTQVAADASADDDAFDSSQAPVAVSLQQHLGDVRGRARAYASSLGLPADLVEALGLAGYFHDLGKADARFQAMLRGSTLWRAEAAGVDAGDLLAKSDPIAFGRPGRWPRGYRHEAISLALLEAANEETFAGVDRALVEHLVASHHGHARPLFPALDDGAPIDVRVTLDGADGRYEFKSSSADSHPNWDQPTRFDALCARYGTWGLAFLEAVLRLADISISEEYR